MAVHVRYKGGSGVVIGEAGPMAPGDVMTVESEEAAEKFTRRGDFEVVAQVDSPDAPAEDAPAPDAPAEEEGDVEKAADAPDAPAEAPEEAPPAEETTGDEGAAEAAPSAGTQE